MVANWIKTKLQQIENETLIKHYHNNKNKTNWNHKNKIQRNQKENLRLPILRRLLSRRTRQKQIQGCWLIYKEWKNLENKRRKEAKSVEEDEYEYSRDDAAIKIYLFFF